MKLLAAVILLGLVAARASAQPAPQPSDVLAAVQAHYTEAATFRAKLRYELTPAGKPRHTLRIDGMLEAVRPSTVNVFRFRPRVAAAVGPVSSALAFVLANPTFATDFVAAFDTSGRYGREHDVVLALTPTAATPTLRSMILVLPPDAHRLIEVVVVDLEGNRHHYRLYEQTQAK